MAYSTQAGRVRHWLPRGLLFSLAIVLFSSCKTQIRNVVTVSEPRTNGIVIAPAPVSPVSPGPAPIVLTNFFSTVTVTSPVTIIVTNAGMQPCCDCGTNDLFFLVDWGRRLHLDLTNAMHETGERQNKGLTNGDIIFVIIVMLCGVAIVIVVVELRLLSHAKKANEAREKALSELTQKILMGIINLPAETNNPKTAKSIGVPELFLSLVVPAVLTMLEKVDTHRLDEAITNATRVLSMGDEQLHRIEELKKKIVNMERGVDVLQSLLETYAMLSQKPAPIKTGN